MEIDGCRYREGLNAVRIEGGVAGNVVPDECRVTVNFRYAPDRDYDAAEAHVREVFADAVAAGVTLTVVDNAGGALPGLAEPAAAAFVAAVGRPAAGQAGLDRRRPLRRLRHPRRQLRPRRPAARAHPRGVGARGAPAARRGRTGRVPVDADRLTTIPWRSAA